MLSAKRYHCFTYSSCYGVGITGLSFLRYPTYFTSKRRITFPVSGFSFFPLISFSVDSFVLAIGFFLLEEHLLEGGDIPANGDKSVLTSFLRFF